MRTKKALLAALCAALLVVGSVMGTMAYLTSTTEEVVNTFTVGKVSIAMDEAKVDLYGDPLNADGVKVDTVDEAARVKTNTYKLLPGHEYIKDPTVTVADKSELAYVRMLVTVDGLAGLKTLFPDFITSEGVFQLEELVTGWDESKWEINNVNGNVYEFRYTSVVDARNGAQELEPLFESVLIPGENVTSANINNLDGVKITVVANAIQADGFANADAAWAAFN